jgi:hypothetical protein
MSDAEIERSAEEKGEEVCTIVLGTICGFYYGKLLIDILIDISISVLFSYCLILP